MKKTGAQAIMNKNALAPLVATTAIQIMSSLAVLTVPVLAPMAAADIGISVTYVGVFVGLVYLGAMISSVIGGSLVMRFGAIRVSQVCLLLGAAGMAMAMVAQPWALAVGALLIGCGYGPVTPASSHVLAKTTPRHLTSTVFSIKQTGVPLGGVLAGLVLPPLAIAAGWHITLAAVGASCLIVAALVQPLKNTLDADRQPGRALGFVAIFAPLNMVARSSSLRPLALTSLFYASMQMCLVGYLVTYLVKDLGMPMVHAGIILAVAQGGGIVGRILWGSLADRWIAPRLMLGLLGLLMTAGAAFTAAFTRAWPLPALLACCAVFGSAAIGWNGVQLAQLARLAPPGEAGLATGGSLFFAFLGVVAGPPLFGAIVGAGLGYPAAYLLAAVAPLGIGLRFSLTRAPNEPAG